MKIPLHELLLDLRRDLVEEGVAPWWERAGFTLWSWAWSSPLGYRASTRSRGSAQPLGGLAGPGRVVGARPFAAEIRPALPGPAMSAWSTTSSRTRRRSGFHVHRGAAPELEGAGVSRALYGLADTGSVVLAAVAGRAAGRLAPAGRSRHAARRTRILPGLDELFAALGDDLPSALAIVTGPSRSADIEQKLAVGVHGPREVHVVLV